jgi:hypothetical protein
MPDRQEVEKRVLDDSYPLKLYYAHCIPNNYAIDFDILTRNL